jgi:hypothetical protein
MYKTHLPLLSSDVRDSAAVVYGPTFRCLVPPLLPIHCHWFVVWSSCVQRSVASTDEMTQHCITCTQNSCVPHHITLHYITSHHITQHITSHVTPPHVTSQHTTAHHITSHHITTLCRFCCKMCTQGHRTLLCIHSRKQTTHFYGQIKRQSQTTQC